jgi:hypothetical protein
MSIRAPDTEKALYSHPRTSAIIGTPPTPNSHWLVLAQRVPNHSIFHCRSAAAKQAPRLPDWNTAPQQAKHRSGLRATTISHPIQVLRGLLCDATRELLHMHFLLLPIDMLEIHRRSCSSDTAKKTKKPKQKRRYRHIFDIDRAAAEAQVQVQVHSLKPILIWHSNFRPRLLMLQPRLLLVYPTLPSAHRQ